MTAAEPREGSPSRLMVAVDEPTIYPVLRRLDALRPHEMPPCARFVLLAVAAELERDASGRLLGAVAVAAVARTTGLRVPEVASVIGSLVRRDWLVPLEDTARDLVAVKAYELRLDGRTWERGEGL